MCKVVAAAPRITVGSSLLTAGGTLAIKSARIAPNLPRCGARADGRNAPAAALPTEPRRLLRLNLPRARHLALPGHQLAHLVVLLDKEFGAIADAETLMDEDRCLSPPL